MVKILLKLGKKPINYGKNARIDFVFRKEYSPYVVVND